MGGLEHAISRAQGQWQACRGARERAARHGPGGAQHEGILRGQHEFDARHRIAWACELRKGRGIVRHGSAWHRRGRRRGRAPLPGRSRSRQRGQHQRKQTAPTGRVHASRMELASACAPPQQWAVELHQGRRTGPGILRQAQHGESVLPVQGRRGPRVLHGSPPMELAGPRHVRRIAREAPAWAKPEFDCHSSMVGVSAPAGGGLR